ncbi:hypothetical protein [Methylohalobius crimeensis]|uniref:hypothetical protein n=1 Tax=Methylohalobius crimeensis TaxID=244365 RepID=UPI0003FDB3A5
MDQAVEDCLVTGHEQLIDGLELPDPDDRHVLAAAIRAGAQLIVTQLMSDELNKLDYEYASRHTEGIGRLAEDSNWQQLEPEQRHQLLSEQKLTQADRPKVAVESTDEVLNTLDHCSLAMFADRVAAMPARFDHVASAAAELCEPEIQFVSVPRRTLKTEANIDARAEEVKDQFKTALEKGPISVK